jgi:hypothetical protein
MIPTNYNSKEMKEYLLGKKLANKHDNIIGAVLGFSKKLNFNNITKKNDTLAILLFLDFRTGRVERYIVNLSDTDINKGIDYKDDLYFTKLGEGEKYKILHENQHTTVRSRTSFIN